MSTSDVVAIVVGFLAIYLQWQQNQIFRQQNAIFAAQAGGPAPVEISAKQRFRRYWPMLAMLLLTVTTLGAVAFDYYDRHSGEAVIVDKEKWDKIHLQTIYSHTYTDEVVPLDGKKYVDCTFNGATFTYEGSGPAAVVRFRLKSVNGHPDFGFHTKNLVVAQTLEILKNLGALRPDLDIAYDPSVAQ